MAEKLEARIRFQAPQRYGRLVRVHGRFVAGLVGDRLVSYHELAVLRRGLARCFRSIVLVGRADGIGPARRRKRHQRHLDQYQSTCFMRSLPCQGLGDLFRPPVPGYEGRVTEPLTAPYKTLNNP